MMFRSVVLQSAIIACCLALPAFPQQASQPDKNSGPTSGLSTASPKASDSSQSKIIEPDGVYQVGGLVLPPKVISAPDPKYTFAARLAEKQGHCIVTFVVDRNGKPRDIQVKKALGKGLDQSAIKAVKKYRF